MIKRLGQQVTIVNGGGSGLPFLNQTGGGTWEMTATPTGGSLGGTYQYGLSGQFQLNAVQDHTDITQLFDRYKIVGIKLKFLFQHNVASVSGNSCLPVMYHAFDADDANVPTSANDVMVKAYCKTRILNGNREFSVYYKPRISKEIFQGPFAGPGYSTEKAAWLDCNSSAIPHYGFKAWIDNWLAPDNALLLRIQPVYYLALKDTQ